MKDVDLSRIDISNACEFLQSMDKPWKSWNNEEQGDSKKQCEDLWRIIDYLMGNVRRHRNTYAHRTEELEAKEAL